MSAPAPEPIERDQRTETDARTDWEQRIYRRLTDTTGADPRLSLPAPAGVTATGAVGHIRLDWHPVDGAAGYLIERTDPNGAHQLLQHGGSDVPAVPSSPFADTGLRSGDEYRYRVSAVAGAEYPAWNWSDWVGGVVSAEPAEVVSVAVDATAEVGRIQRVWELVGSERLTQLRFDDDGNGNDIGAEFAEALRLAVTDLGVRRVRAHAILHDDNHVVARAVDGSLTYDFSAVDALYDQLIEIGLRPLVELSFMPTAIARDAAKTVFDYRGIISPPRDWSEWHAVVHALADHLVARYGIDDVGAWGFEVWNEPNLEVFWTGTQQEYLRLYDEAVAAVKEVDERLTVGGPSTAAGEWIEALATHAEQSGVALDFVTSHTYGNLPLDTRASLHRHGFDGIPAWWTEWGVGSTHFGPIHDGVAGAPFVLSGMQDVQGRIQALAYWVISDHFEELGRPPKLFHNGFGLLTVGNLRKPRYWAAHLAAHQGERVLATQLSGDGAGVLVRAWATRHDTGTVDVLLWNGTINAALMDGDPSLDRTVELTVAGVALAGARATLARIDQTHSNIVAGIPADLTWPDEARWQSLHERDRLHECDVAVETTADGRARLVLPLPMPGVARVRLVPADAGSPEKEGSR